MLVNAANFKEIPIQDFKYLQNGDTEYKVKKFAIFRALLEQISIQAPKMYSSILGLLLLLLSTLSSCTPVVVRETTLASSAVPISKITVSLGIEFCYIVDYLGDIEGSSKLSKRLLQNIQDIRGESPIIRIGGHTQDAAQYCSG